MISNPNCVEWPCSFCGGSINRNDEVFLYEMVDPHRRKRILLLDGRHNDPDRLLRHGWRYTAASGRRKDKTLDSGIAEQFEAYRGVLSEPGKLVPVREVPNLFPG